jgi:alkylation response protein AidB-like acyl-CoA dehydrogenase
VAFKSGVRATRTGETWTFEGETPPVDHAAHAAIVLIEATSPDGPVWLFVEPAIPGVRVEPPVPTLGLRGLDACRIGFESARIPSRNLLAGEIGPELLALVRLGVAATGVGLAQAGFEAALRYAQQRTTFGKPIAQHQAIQLALAGMATKITAARLLAYDAAAGLDDAKLLSAKVYASEVAYEVALDSMRVHGGYGYTSEFPVERYYRDAAHLASSPTTNAADRLELARRLGARGDAGGDRAPAR